MLGIRTQFANKILMNRTRLCKRSKSSPPLTRSPMESITGTTKKSSTGNGRTNMPSFINAVAESDVHLARTI